MLEKTLEAKACRKIKELGGLALKFNSTSSRGWPDRLILLNHGVLFWVEFKAQGKKPTKLQLLRRKALINRGFRVYYCDCVDQFDKILCYEGVL
jgi:hypothetical protein